MHEVVREMRAVADEFDDRVLIGEIYLPLERLVRYYGDDLGGLHLPFNFTLVTMPRWDAPSVRRVIERYEAALPVGAWPNWVLGNHDVSRVATRSGPVGGRLAHLLLLTLRGTPTCYYGDELGLGDGDIPPERVVDPQANAGLTRDVARTPMPWSEEPNAGFCPPEVTPWLPISMPTDGSVERQAEDPHSPLALVRRLLQVRREHDALRVGSLHMVDAGDDGVVAFLRQHGEQRVLVVVKLRSRPGLRRPVGHRRAGKGTGGNRDGPRRCH